MRTAVPVLAVVTLLAWQGCLPPPIVRDRDSACRVARSAMRSSLSPADLFELTGPWPRPHQLARRAYHGRLAGIVLTALGGAGLAGAFITGFAADTTQPGTRIALYSVVGGTIGLGAGALLAGALTIRARNAAVSELDSVTRIECP